MDPDTRRELTQEEIELFKFQSAEWGLCNGFAYRDGMAPHCTPGGIPSKLVSSVISVSPLFNKLVHVVSQNLDYMLEAHKDVTDSFTQSLIQIATKVRDAGGDGQPVQFGIFRSDYMLHQPEGTPKEDSKLLQVEINTISASFLALSNRVQSLHKYLAERGFLPGFEPTRIPVTNASEVTVDAFAKAIEIFNVPKAIVVMVVLPNEGNTTDQRHLEYDLWNKHKIVMRRYTLLEIAQIGKLDATTKQLTINGEVVGVFYLRAGYAPTHHPTQEHWDARLNMELSNAFVVPNIRYHLAGTKKMQQVLSLPGALEKFFTPEESSTLRAFFAGLYSLDAADNPKEIIEKVIAQPGNYVMKPQREGGGSLLYHEKMVEALKTMSPQELGDYIIMDRIVPPAEQTYFQPNRDTIVAQPGVSELGTYGFILAKDNEYILNTFGGLLLRTKSEEAEDGGVCSGVAFLSSVYQL